jgi:hypothetical protein
VPPAGAFHGDTQPADRGDQERGVRDSGPAVVGVQAPFQRGRAGAEPGDRMPAPRIAPQPVRGGAEQQPGRTHPAA